MEEFKKIRDLASRPVKTEREMKQVEIIFFAFNEHEFIADKVIGPLIKHANYPFKISIVDNTRQIVPINFSRIWNKFIQESKCDFICFMDSDVIVHPDYLKRIMESFDDPTIDVVLPVMDRTSSNQQKVASEAPYPSFEPLREILAAQIVFYRRSVFEKVGYFDERFLLYGQDSEWGHRFLKKGGKGIVRHDVFVNHVGSYSLDKFAADHKALYNQSVEREYARSLFKHLTQ